MARPAPDPSMQLYMIFYISNHQSATGHLVPRESGGEKQTNELLK